MLNSELIDNILKDAGEIPAAAEKFRQYSKEVLNYKPGGWSAADCFEHLLMLNQKYIPIFEKIRKTYTDTGGKEFGTSLMGRFIIKSVHPDAPRKVKTMPAFNPVSIEADSSVIDRYLKQHTEIRRYMESFRNYDLKKIKITSPLSSLVKYNLGDACQIIINHDLRHLKQAQRAVEAYYAGKQKVG